MTVNASADHIEGNDASTWDMLGLVGIDWDYVPAISLLRVLAVSAAAILWAALILAWTNGQIAERDALLLCIVLSSSFLFLFEVRSESIQSNGELKKIGAFHRDKILMILAYLAVIFCFSQVLRETFTSIWTPKSIEDWQIVFGISVYVMGAPRIVHKNWLSYRYGRYEANVWARH